MPNLFTVLSPISGALVPLCRVPDPVFGKKMLGDGVAIDPTEEVLCAPFDGIISNFNKNHHALVLTNSPLEMLIHVGLESIQLKGKGFTALVKPGDAVLAGQPLLRFEQSTLAKQLACPFVLCIVTSPRNARLIHSSAETICTGQPLFQVAISEQSVVSCPLQPFLQSEPITILNRHGLHARPAGQLAKLACAYPHAVYICKGSRRVNAKSITAIMGLALVQGDQITLQVEGPAPQAHALLAQLENGFATEFGEGTHAPGSY